MSFADVIVNFGITIIGAVLILLLTNRISALQRQLADRWAQRSVSATRKRIEKIENELANIIRLRDDFQAYYSEIELIKAKSSSMALVGFVNLIVLTGLGTMVYIITILNKDYLSAKAILILESDLLTYLKVFVSIGYAVSVFYIFSASYKQIRLRKLLDTEKTIGALAASAEKLRKKIQ